MPRIISMFGTIEHDNGKDFIQHLYDLNIESETKPIHVLIDSYGGDLDVAWAIYDLFRASTAPVWTYNIGSAFSAGLVAFLAGKKRFATKHCTFLAHAPRFMAGDDYKVPADIQSSGTHGVFQQKLLGDIIYDNSNLDLATALSWVQKDTYFYLKDALNCGIVGFEISTFPSTRMIEDSPSEIIGSPSKMVSNEDD